MTACSDYITIQNIPDNYDDDIKKVMIILYIQYTKTSCDIKHLKNSNF